MSVPPKKVKLTYFPIEGASECVRLALTLSGVEFEDERVDYEEWRSTLKAKTPNGQLPVLTLDDGPMMPQSEAILRYVGTGFGVEGAPRPLYPVDKLYTVEEAMADFHDMGRSWMPCMYLARRPEVFGHPAGLADTDEGKALVKSLREAFVKNDLPKFLDRFAKKLAHPDSKGWLVPGHDSPTIADCLVVPFLRGFTRGHIDHVDTKCLETHPSVVEYIRKFCALPPLKGRYTNGLGSPAYDA